MWPELEGLALNHHLYCRFRWAVCQVEALKSCNKVSSIKTALANLPESLFDSYERILLSIGQASIADASSIMQWIAFAKRPLTLEEVAEAATAVPGTEDIDSDDKLYDPYDVLRICRSLLSLSQEHVCICGKWEFRQVVRFAHASVREYLVSDHLAKGPVFIFSLLPQDSHLKIGGCCISALLRNRVRHEAPWDPLSMPLLRYAAEFWFRHAEGAGLGYEETTNLEEVVLEDEIIRLFNSSLTVFRNWLTIYDPDLGRSSDRLRGSTPSPLYYAALLGLFHPADTLIHLGYEVNHHHWGRYGPSLAAAAAKGNYGMVRLLLSRGADVNILGGPLFGSPLQAACFSGSMAIVRELIKNGGLVNICSRSAKHETPLEIACEYGYRDIVESLLENDADVNASGGGHGSALHAAASRGYLDVCSLLLSAGANVNLEGGHFGSPLQAAVAADSESLTKLLLDKGAKPNVQGGGFRDALRAAAWRRNLSTFTMLLEHGADVNLSMTKLREYATVTRGNEDEILLDRISNVKDQKDGILLELVRQGAERIAQIESEQYLAGLKDRRRQLRPNTALIRSIVQYQAQQDIERYRSDAIPDSWIARTARPNV